MKNLLIYSTAHFFVDFCCAFLLFFLAGRFDAAFVLENASENGVASNLAALFLLYNVLAFGTEFVFGLYVDEKESRRCAGVGIALLLAATAGGGALATAVGSWETSTKVLLILAFLTVLAAGVGNSLFHLGGGIDALAQSLGKERKYWRSGVFISTGALGLAAGTLVGTFDGQSGNVSFVAIGAALSLVAVGIWTFQRPSVSEGFGAFETAAETRIRREISNGKRNEAVSPGAMFCVLCAISAVGVRSFGGFFAPDFASARLAELAQTGVFFLATAAFLGKVLGGFLADRFGGATVGFVATASAIPALCWGESLGAFFVGVFLLNVSTATTLVATAENCGGRLGFAFGLTTLALLGGYFLAAVGIGKDASPDGWADWTGLFLAGALLLAAFQTAGAVLGTERKRDSLKTLENNEIENVKPNRERKNEKNEAKNA